MPSYGAFSANSHSNLALKIFAEVEKRAIPLEATLELTQDCNFRCTHCYNFDRSLSPLAAIQDPVQNSKTSEPLTPKGQTLTIEEIFILIDELENLGCLNLTLTGGEALLSPLVLPIIKEVRSRHMGVYLKTNGSLLNAQRVRSLKEARLMGLEVSIYGNSAATHDSFANVPGSLNKIWQGIATCIEYKLPVKIQFVLTRYNAHEVVDMLDHAKSMGIEYAVNPQLSARYDGTNTSLDHRLTEEQLGDLYRGPLRDEIPAPDMHPRASVQCGCARGICGIGYEGTVYPCIGAPLPAGNLRSESFTSIWLNSPVFKTIRGLVLEDFKKCEPCPDRPYCRRSSGLVYVNTRNYTGAEDWTCMEAKTLHSVWEEKENESNVTL